MAYDEINDPQRFNIMMFWSLLIDLKRKKNMQRKVVVRNNFNNSPYPYVKIINHFFYTPPSQDVDYKRQRCER